MGGSEATCLSSQHLARGQRQEDCWRESKASLGTIVRYDLKRTRRRRSKTGRKRRRKNRNKRRRRRKEGRKMKVYFIRSDLSVH